MAATTYVLMPGQRVKLKSRLECANTFPRIASEMVQMFGREVTIDSVRKHPLGILFTVSELKGAWCFNAEWIDELIDEIPPLQVGMNITFGPAFIGRPGVVVEGMHKWQGNTTVVSSIHKTHGWFFIENDKVGMYGPYQYSPEWVRAVKYDPSFIRFDIQELECPEKLEPVPDIVPAVMSEEGEGRKFDDDKPRMHLLPPRALELVAGVLTFGAQKYNEGNWKKVPKLSTRYTSAALRHIFSYMKGEALDPESGYHHLAHAACCLLFILEDTSFKGEDLVKNPNDTGSDSNT